MIRKGDCRYTTVWSTDCLVNSDPRITGGNYVAARRENKKRVPMSRSHFLFHVVPMDAWVDRYEKSHQNPINRVLHTFGIPMIAVSIPLFLIAPLVRGSWKIPLSLFTAGWICQVLGHIIED
jgi:uncharacterized membrane protein YGL010W